MINLKDLISNRGERNFQQVFEQYGERITRREILPGHYYSFDIEVPNMSRSWLPNSSEEYSNSPNAYLTSKSVYNLNPVGLAVGHGTWSDNLLMIDFKVIPPRYHSSIVSAHLNLIEENLDQINAFDEDREMMDLTERSKTNLAMYNITPSILERASGVNLKPAISAYKLGLVRSAKILDYDRIGEFPMAAFEKRGIVLSSGTMDISRIYDIFEQKQ